METAIEIAKNIQNSLNEMSAAEAADYLISPYVAKDLLNLATSEPGTAMWIVNRSDVYDLTLQKLFDHPLTEIATRARDKYNMRHSSLQFLSPPEDPGPLHEIPDYAVEEVLGHPLAPFEAMIYFAKSVNPDHRVSAALSLTRRLVEHPPNWTLNLDLKNHLTEVFFKLLLEDTSQFVKSYAARVPLFTESHLEEALKKETNDFVLGRLLQNPATSPKTLNALIEKTKNLVENFYFSLAVACFDERLNPDLKQSLARENLPALHQELLKFPRSS